jgi:hypothetical protein
MSDWKSDLVGRYPHLFGPGGYPTVGAGWRELLEEVVAAIDKARDGGDVSIVQIKEKFGTLRLYRHDSGLSERAKDEINDAVRKAEARSAVTCEICGAEGRLHNLDGYVVTRCPDHAAGK